MKKTKIVRKWLTEENAEWIMSYAQEQILSKGLPPRRITFDYAVHIIRSNV